MVIDETQKAFYINQIKQIAKRNSASRLIGWANNFYKIFYYRSLMLLNKTKELEIKTFWQGKMNIILPEGVSINIWRNGFAESDVSIYLLKYLNKDETFIDIGAHFGFYSLLASSIVGREGHVLAFEPTNSTFKQLSKNIRNSNYENIKIYNLAAYNKNTVMEFNDYGIINSSFNSFFVNRGENKLLGEKIKVNTIVLDDFLVDNYSDRKIDMIKIDAESSEYQIISGLNNTIRKYHPKIILEIGDYSIDGVKNSKDLIALIESFGYKGFELNKINYKIIPYTIKNNERYNNILFIPT